MARLDDSTPAACAARADSLPPELLGRAAAGHRDAQQQLLLAHIGRVRRLIHRLVSHEADVEDLVQICCVEVLRSLPRFKGQASLKLWVDRIATRTVYKHYRSTRRRRARITLSIEPDTQAEQQDERRRTEWRDGIRQARAVVDRLKPERRIVFLLVTLEGRSLQEVATMLDLSLSAAKSRFLRARRDVDKQLAQEPGLLELLKGSAR